MGPSAAPTFASAAVSPVGPAGDPASIAAAHALSAAHAAGVRSNLVFVPRPSASPAQLLRTSAGAPVAPLYSATPAPMGLAYYGLTSGPNGSVVGSVLNTTRVMANVDANATGIRPLDLVQSSPDSYGLQLNAVVTGVTLFGHTGYSFWTQNVVLFYPDTHQMILVTNVWNFSNGAAVLSGNAIFQNGIGGSFSDGPNGTNSVGLLGFYYAEKILSTPITYPFNLSLFLNSTVQAGRNLVSFGIQLTGPGEHLGASAWDYVVFNSIHQGSASTVSRAANYTANGLAYNALGLTNDFEIVVGGPGGGSQATLFSADAAFGLAYYNGASFVSVPSAFSYGGETGETATGANVAWSNAPGGPAGLATYGTMTSGPSYLDGLWNTTTPEGSFPLTIVSDPANAFQVLTPTGASTRFSLNESAVAPGAFTNSFPLVPGNYSVLTELSGYSPSTSTVHLTGPTTIYVNLTSNPGLGVYTPLWAFSNGEVAALATAGTGTAADPYRMPTLQPSPIGATFGLYNDFGFPVYPAVFLYGTSVATEFAHPPPFTTTTNTFHISPTAFPALNDLPYWFWHVSNVSVLNATNISGWFPQATFSPLGFNTFNVVLYESDHNLLANNTFHTQAEALLLYSGGTFFGSLNVGGGNNTVWGNTFRAVHGPSSGVGTMTLGEALGIEVAEPSDLLYNNWVGTPTTAWQLPANLYSGTAEFFNVSWNISSQPAANVHFASGFPFEPLTGSVAGTSFQGGNFWWDYGSAHNPFNGANNPYLVLPYEERATTPIGSILGPGYYSRTYLYPGGDFVPLANVVLYPVTFLTSPVTTGVDWGVVVAAGNQTLVNNTTDGPNLTVSLPNGTYTVHSFGSRNFSRAGPLIVSLVVSGGPVVQTLPFHTPRGYHTLAFTRGGLPKGTNWSVSINATNALDDDFNLTGSTTAGRLVFAVLPGNYTFSVTHEAGYTVNHPNGTLFALNHSAGIRLQFRLVVFSVAFTESGLPNGTSWSVTLGTKTHGASHPTILFSVPNGTYPFHVHPKAGWAANYVGTVVVNGSGANVSIVFSRIYYNVTFSETGLPNGTNWSVKLAGVTEYAIAPASIVFAKTNGSYSFTVGPVVGFVTGHPSGTVHVAGAPVSTAVGFSPAPPSFASSGLLPAAGVWTGSRAS